MELRPAGQADVRHSASTWQQPTPPAASPRRSALVALLARRVAGLGGGRLLVGIDGFTAAGKTGFGHELARHIAAAGRPVLRATLDDFKKPWRDRHLYDRESGEGYYRNAFDYEAVERLLLRRCRRPGETSAVLCSTDPLTQRDHSDRPTPLAPDTVLIVDGVFAFRPEINAYWDFRIWLHVDPEVSVRRGAQHDRERCGADADADAETIHRDRYPAAHRVYLREADPLPGADVVIDNTVFSDPRVVKDPAALPL